MRGIIVAGTHSGCGKTTITLGLLAALRKKGLVVQPFKAGPDFIDTGLHGFVTGRPARNLDLWMCGEEYVRACFARHAAEADIAVVEGVMGMYDGEYSTARLASVLELPVILIIDAYGMAESAGAVVMGFLEFGVQSSEFREKNSGFKTQNSKLLTPDSEIQFAGVIFNRVGSERHFKRLKDCVADVPVMGYLPREVNFTIPHRHLGLQVAEETPISQEEINRLADTVLEHIDVDMIIQDSKFNIQNSGLNKQESELLTPNSKLKVAVAYDKAFCFYYEDNLEMLKDAGVEIVRFSPLHDDSLPEGIDGLYLGGGYPELYARELSANRAMIASVRKFSEAGHSVYGECGGFMYLTEGIYDFDGRFYPMAGIFPFKTRMHKSRANLGYREIILRNESILGGAGTVIRGHEFHYSEITPPIPPLYRGGMGGVIFSVKDGGGNHLGDEGYLVGSTLGSYIHLHFGSNPDAAQQFVGEIIKHNETNVIPAKAGIQGETNELDSAFRNGSS